MPADASQHENRPDDPADQQRHRRGTRSGEDQHSAGDNQDHGQHHSPVDTFHAAAPEIIVQQQSGEKTARDTERNAEHQEQSIAEKSRKVGIGEQLRKVGETDRTELLILEHVMHFKVPVRKRHEKADGERNRRKSKKAQDIGEQKKNSGGNFPNIAASQFQHDYSAPFSIPR